MAGIYDRIGTDDNVPVHLLTSAVLAGALGWFTNTKLLNTLNAELETDLDAASQTDLLAIKAEIAGFLLDGQKADYLWKLEAALIAQETNTSAFTESEFRSAINIA